MKTFKRNSLSIPSSEHSSHGKGFWMEGHRLASDDLPPDLWMPQPGSSPNQISI